VRPSHAELYPLSLCFAPYDAITTFKFNSTTRAYMHLSGQGRDEGYAMVNTGKNTGDSKVSLYHLIFVMLW
jgi:hypothetical protein